MRENAIETIEKFGNNQNCSVVILIGQDLSSERVSRDIAVFSTLCNQLGNDVSVLIIIQFFMYIYSLICSILLTDNPSIDFLHPTVLKLRIGQGDPR